METKKNNRFTKIGNLIIRRKYAILVAWLLILILVVPFIFDLSNVVSLQMDTASDKNLESQKASDLISSQFSSTVANDTLMVVISSENVSSLQTQDFIERVIERIKIDSRISNLENVTSIYTILIPTINQTNQAIYTVYDNANLTFNLIYGVPTAYMTIWETAYNQTIDTLVLGLNETNNGVYLTLDNANMTYNLLYGVPTAYMTIWETAYNQTKNTLVQGITETNQGVYTVFENANQTFNLLYSVPAIFLNAWSQTYMQTQDVSVANSIAYDQSATILAQADPIAYAQYTSHLLNAFNSSWVESFQNPATLELTPIERAVMVSDQVNQIYINNFLATNQTAKTFATTLTNTLTLTDYLTNTQTQNNQKLQNFSAQYVANASESSVEFVNATFNLGRNPRSEDINLLSENMIFNSNLYNLGQDFIATFNAIAYNETATYLQQLDPESYEQYTVHLLNAFNNAWLESWQSASAQQYTVLQRAIVASNQANQIYINNFLATNQTAKTFATTLTNTLTLTDYLTNTQTQNNQKLQNFSIQYVSQSGNVSEGFVNAAYNLNIDPSFDSLVDLATKIIRNPDSYDMGQNFIDTFNEVAYNQTAIYLSDIDEDSFEQYTSYLLDLFNESWVQTFQNSDTLHISVEERATLAIEQASLQYINLHMDENAEFGIAVSELFSLQDFIANDTYQISQKLDNFSVSFIANQSGLSSTFINAIFNLGRNYDQIALQNLAGNIVCSPESFDLMEQLVSGVDSLVSQTKEVTLISIGLTNSNSDTLAIVREIIKSELIENSGDVNSALVTGRTALNSDFGDSATQDLDFILPVTIVLLIAATGLFFRSIITPLVTLGTIGVGLGISQIFIVLVGTYVNKVDFMIPTILLTVLLGVGTDYSIFIIARHREELVNGLSVKEAILKAITWAGESIVTSGTTVIISFLGLAITTMVLLQTLGIIVGVSVIVALLVSLTLVPALAVILGSKLFWPNSGERFQRYADRNTKKNNKKSGYFARSGTFSVKHAKVIIILAILITVPMLYVCDASTPTYNFLGGASKDLESIKAMNTLSDCFGGSLFPSYVVVTFTEPLISINGTLNTLELSQIQTISEQLLSYNGIKQVKSATMPYGTLIEYANLTVTNSTNSDYSAVLANIGKDNKTALITIDFQIDPYSNEALNVIQDMRSALHSNFDDTNNIDSIYVGGTTGSMLDVKIVFDNQFNTILPIVTIAVGIILFIVLGSLVLPLFAILSVLMSIVWTLGVTVLVFQTGFNYGLLFITPMILLVLLLGIGMDYNIFILTRIREESAKGQKLNDAIVHAIQQTGGIITAAAIILAGSLGALMLSSNLLLKEMGFAFAFSILIDALVVRTYLVPAVMSALGKWNWYNPLPFFKRSKTLFENKKEQ